ncbi:MAG TPA: branched-chain amino acid ABC transporter permease [Gaiellaceae bacterium]|nr:branched-chain amino acid ABC transporter permease [Gaiellaceae bacterium]
MARIGTDEWVAQQELRTETYRGLTAPARRALDRVAPGPRLAAFLAICAVFPFLTGSDFLIRVGVNVLLFALLALGLNIVVGWAGLLDLGYVAFYGFGAYAYAWVSSEQFGLHWPTIASIPAVVAASALLGVLLGLPSRRLVGDYLAITTLFFLQVFVELALNLDRITLPGADEPLNLTGGPNGIPGVDAMRILTIDFLRTRDYYFLLLVVFALVVVGLYFLNNSRTGRAWRASNEDPLAAELMTTPVNRLKLLAFAMGAAIAGLTGTIFAAVQVGVFPQNFEVTLLIMVYAALILGGAGSISGAVLGAIIVASVPEILRTPENARYLFYIAVVLVLVATVRPWQRLGALAAAVVVFGFAVHEIVALAWPDGVAAEARGGGLGGILDSWVVLPDVERTTIGNVAFVLLVAAVLAVTRLRGDARLALLVPTLYLAAFVWENRLIFQPSVTRQLLFGAVLVAMMTARPHGLLGTPRVESPV